MSNLLSQKCAPCEGGTPGLNPQEVAAYLLKVPGWDAADDKKITREFQFADFKAAMAFVARVAEIAENEQHHPDILIHGWNKVRLALSTHAIHGLSENDFILAAKINEVVRQTTC